ncbi:MAG: prepilin-type N-terminal cleavage/methylation domain-containing protein [Gammaproteobacteria bacterium]|nr:prepilin-type N-terminal cleavage/methylation domain-containing protein [Gammaproteobacteria bacterium]
MSTAAMRCQAGYSFVEILVTAALAAIVLAGLSGVSTTLARSRTVHQATAERLEQAQFALADMTGALRRSSRLVLPLADDPATAWAENPRQETVGAGDPGAVLAFALDASVDRNGDGYADADNDHDGRVDEDWPADMNDDGVNGIGGIDDNGNGSADLPKPAVPDDDESGGNGSPHQDEDPLDGLDNDGDGSIDEDPGADMNGDGAPGIAGIDDDGDGATDEGSVDDDDEDGLVDEDWLDTVVYFLAGSTLMKRVPVPWDTDGDSSVTGADYVETAIAEDVEYFAVERRVVPGARYDSVTVTLRYVASAELDALEVSATARVGAGQ